MTNYLIRYELVVPNPRTSVVEYIVGSDTTLAENPVIAIKDVYHQLNKVHEDMPTMRVSRLTVEAIGYD